MSKEELIEYYVQETNKILHNSSNPDKLRPLVNRMLMKLQNKEKSSTADMVKANKEMWESFYELNNLLKENFK